ncbi:MAG: MlaD family protein [Verrucomicrobia bacterium]|nr:MlaD family protein [Verrucomicrobiota bacterium]MDA1086255.1 MlaD family protein [Verrucomicrobiota bacterium]
MRKDIIARELTIEIVVGAFAFMVLLALAYFTIIIGHDKLFKDEHRYQVEFRDVRGLRKGDNVVVRGVPIGQVAALELTDTGVLLTLALGHKLHFKEDYRVEVIATSILGGNYLLVSEGSENAPALTEGQRLIGDPGHDLVGEAGDLVGELRETFIDGGVLENLQATVRELKEISEKINSGAGTIGMLVNDPKVYEGYESLISNLHIIVESIADGEGTLGKLAQDDALYDNMAAFTGKLTNETSTLGRLLSPDDQIYEDLSASIASLRKISESMEKGEGTLGKLLADDTVYDDLSQLLKETRATVDDFRENSPIVTFTSVFFGAL